MELHQFFETMEWLNSFSCKSLKKPSEAKLWTFDICKRKSREIATLKAWFASSTQLHGWAWLQGDHKDYFIKTNWALADFYEEVTCWNITILCDILVISLTFFKLFAVKFLGFLWPKLFSPELHKYYFLYVHTVVCIKVRTASFPRFWKNHP